MTTEKVFLPDYIAREYRKLLKLARGSSLAIDTKLVRAAFTMANNACKQSHIKFNEPLIMQALQVSQIVVSDIGLGTSTVCCAMLYKFVEIGSLEISTVRAVFGDKIAEMTHELAKIASIDTKNTATQPEHFRKLLLTLTSDVRVILTKLADRLYVMRNLDVEDAQQQMRIALETFDLYAPLGHRLGLYALKSELEDLSMKYSKSEMYQYINRKLADTAAARNRFIKDFIAPIKAELDAQKFDYEIKSRTKSIYSIYNKMHKQNVEFDEVYDLFAIRIIINSDQKHEKADCWRIFSVVTSLYQSNPERMRDWISVPKSTGYESLHSTVVVPGGKWVEVQIRTRRMDEIAEKGLAAHWKYKGQKGDDGLDNWLNKIREMLETPDADSLNLIDSVKLGLYSHEIFVFTPKGDLKMLPKGATVLDFAYEVHSGVGDTCVGARVNGKNVPIRHMLNNGDKVEVITSKNQKPKPDWIDFVVTSKAKAKIKLALKESIIQDSETGKELFKRRLRNWKIPFNDILVSKLLKHYKLKTAVDFFAKIGLQEIDMSEIKAIINQAEKAEALAPEKISDAQLKKMVPGLSPAKEEEVLVIDNKMLNGVDYKLAKCCSPIFGDDIFGFVTISDGIKIHRKNCPNAITMTSRFEYRVVKACWAGTDSRTYFQTALRINGNDQIGVLSKVSDIISKDTHVNLRSINVDTNNGIFEGNISLFVKEVGHLDMLLHKLLKVKGVNSVVRADGV